MPETARLGGAAALLRTAVAVGFAVGLNKPGGKLTVITPAAAVNPLTVPIVKVTVENWDVEGMRAAAAIVKYGAVITPPSDIAACMFDAKSYGVLIVKPPQEATKGAPVLKLFAVEDVRVTVSAAEVMLDCAAMEIFVDEMLTMPVKLPVAVAAPTK